MQIEIMLKLKKEALMGVNSSALETRKFLNCNFPFLHFKILENFHSKVLNKFSSVKHRTDAIIVLVIGAVCALSRRATRVGGRMLLSYYPAVLGGWTEKVSSSLFIYGK